MEEEVLNEGGETQREKNEEKKEERGKDGEELEDEAIVRRKKDVLEKRSLEETVDFIQSMLCLPMISRMTWSAHHRSLVSNFVKNPKERLLCCNILGTASTKGICGPRLSVSLNLPLGNVGAVWYFVKINTKEQLSKKNLSSNLTYGIVQTSDPRSVQHFFVEVFQAFITGQDLNVETSLNTPSLEARLLPVLKRPKTSLPLAVLSELGRLTGIRRQVYLLGAELVHQVGLVLDQPHFFEPKDLICYCKFSSRAEDKLHTNSQASDIEELLLSWVEEIYVFLFKFGQCDSPTEKGLFHQIQETEKKAAVIKALIQIIESPSAAALREFLSQQASPFPFFFQRVTETMKELLKAFLERCEYLRPLKDPLGRIYADSVDAILENVYEVMVILKILWTTSSQDHNGNLMENYFVRLSWDIVRACQYHIPLPDIFSGAAAPEKTEKATKEKDSSGIQGQSRRTAMAESELTKSPVDGILGFCESWRTCYQQLFDHFREEDPSCSLWMPEPTLVFLPVDLFVSRCQDLKYIWHGKHQLTRYNAQNECILTVRSASSLTGCGGPEIDIMEEDLSQVDGVLQEALNAIRAKGRYVFDLTSKEWLKHFDNFREKMEEIEQRYQCVMVSAVQIAETTSQGLEILNAFRPLAARKGLFAVFFIMMDRVLGTFETTFERIEKQYVFRSLRVGKPNFRFSEMALWASTTRKRIEQDINMVRKQSWLPYYSRLDAMYKRASATSEMLKRVVSELYLTWTETLDSNYETKLKQPILKWKPGTIQMLEPNFDKQLHIKLEEAKAWKELGFTVPDKLTEICNESQLLFSLVSKVKISASKFNNLIQRISKDETQLFEAHFQLMVKAFYPGITSLNWRMNEPVKSLCEKSISIVNDVEKEIDDYLEKNSLILQELDILKKLIFYDKKTHRVYQQSEFQEDILFQREAVVTAAKNSLAKIEEVLSILRGKFIYGDSPKTKSAFIQYVTKVDKLIILALKEILKRSLLSFEGLLMGSRCCPSSHLVPVFEISVSMSDNKIICSPPIDIIQETIVHMKEVFEASFSGLPCLLNRFSSEEVKEHCHKSELDDDLCRTLQIKLNEEFMSQSEKLKNELQEWSQFRDLWEVDLDTFFQNYVLNEPDVQSYVRDISSFEIKLQKLSDYPEYVNCGIFRSDVHPLLTMLKEKCQVWIDSFLLQLHKVTQAKLNYLREFIVDTESRMNRAPQSLEEVLGVKDEMILSREKLKVQTLIYSSVSEMFDVLKKYKHPISKIESEEFENLKFMCLKLEEGIGQLLLKLNDQQEMYRKEYIIKAEEVLQIIECTKLNYKSHLPTKSDITQEEANVRIQMVYMSLKDIKKKMSINRELQVLSLPLIQFSELSTYEYELLYLKQVWKRYAEWETAWNSWSSILVWDISCIALQEMLQVHELCFKQLVGGKHGYEHPKETTKEILNYEVEDDLLRKIEGSKELIPLIVNFQNAKLKPHHWQKIKEIIKIEINETSPTFTLSYFQNLNLVLYQSEIDRVFFEAAEETKLVGSLKSVETLCRETFVHLKHVPHLGIHVVHSTKITEDAVKDLIIKLTVIASSPYAKYYLAEIKNNESALNQMATFLQILEDFQKEWLRWNAFFSSPDVRNYLINLSSIYDSLNKKWKSIVSVINADPYLRQIISKDNILTTLEEIVEDIKMLGPFTQNFLLDRCLHYARFCFLSFDDIVGAVSKVHDGESARPFLRKLFMNVDKLKQQHNSKLNCMEIIGVFSEEGEFLELNSYIPVVGEFDVWLSKLDTGIETTLREDVKQCRLTIKTVGIKVDEMLKMWPLQVCIVSYLIQWDLDIAKTFTKDKANETMAKKLMKKITDTVARISSVLQENLSKLLREKLRLFYLIVFKVRDQIEHLSTSPEKMTSFFSYQWEKDANDLSVYVAPYRFTYSWEYQGLCKTTVITPTYYQMVYNISTFLLRGFAIGVLGEEGSGKTEFVASLARFLGRNLKSISVLKRTDLLTLYLLLLGTYQTPTWLLFENANEIPIKLLTSLEDIFSAAKEKSNFTMAKSPSSSPKLLGINGMIVEHDPRASVFFELNLKDSKRCKMIEILKEICRPVVLFPLNVQSVVESYFTQHCVPNPHMASLKLSTLLRTLSQAFPSSMAHLFGLRSVMKIIGMMELMISRSSDVETVDIFPNVLKKFFMIQMDGIYLPVLEEALGMVFPDFDFAPPVDNLLEKATVEELERDYCLVDKSYVNEILNLYDVIKINRKIIVRGPSKCGKSKAIEILAKAVSRLSTDDSPSFKQIICDFLCPQSMRSSFLYGSTAHFQNLKDRGYFSSLLQKISTTSALVEKWVILEGFYSTSWILEVLSHFRGENTFLNNNNHLLSVADNIKIICDITMEEGKHLHSTKDTAIFCFNGDLISWRGILSNGLKRLWDETSSKALKKLINLHLPKFIETLDLTTISNAEMIMKVHAFLAIVKYYLGKLPRQWDSQTLTIQLTPLFIFGIVWGFGTESSMVMRDQINELTTRIIASLPSNFSIFDVAVDRNTLKFCSWEDAFKQNNLRFEASSMNAAKFAFLCQIFVESNIPVLITGTPGSGKTEVLSCLCREKILKTPIYFSYNATTNPFCLNKIIADSVLGNGVVYSDNRAAFLIDNMECHKNSEDLFNALSYLKYVSKHGQIFDENKNSFSNICGIQWICVYQSNNDIKTNIEWMALSKSFQILVCKPFNKKSFKTLFGRFSSMYLTELEQDVSSMKSVIEEALAHLYFRVKPSGFLTKLHHPNLIGRFMKGLSIYNQEYLDRESFIRAFIHEFQRVFFDSGLVTLNEVSSLSSEILSDFFCLSEDIIKEDHKSVVYTQIGHRDLNYSVAAISELYDKISTFCKENKGGLECSVICFPSFVRHLTNILRVFGTHKPSIAWNETRKCVGGNLLLIGQEGSGKATCIRLALKISNWNLIKIEGTTRDESSVYKGLQKGRLSKRPSAILADLNCLNNIENISFLNNLLTEVGAKLHPDSANICLIMCISRLSYLSLIKSYVPSFFQFYATDSFEAWDRHDLEEITLALLNELSGFQEMKLNTENIFSISFFIYQSFAVRQFPSSKYLVYIRLFLRFTKSRVKEFTKKRKWLILNIKKYNETQMSVHELSNQLKKQHAQVSQIQQTCGNTVLKMRNIKSEQGRLEQELNKKSSLLGRQKEESLRIRELINRDLHDPRKEMESIHRDITRITKEDFDSLKKVLRPLPEVEVIFGIVMVILGLEPSWNEVKKQITNVLDLVTRIRKVSIEVVPDQIISYIQQNLPHNINVDPDKSEIPRAALLFYKWIKIFMKYTKVYRDYHPLKLQADTIEKDMEETQNTIKSYQYDLASFSVQHKVLFDQLKEREKSLENAEDKMKSLESKIQLAETVMEQLNHDKITWQESVKKLDKTINEIVGNCLIMSATITYLGYFKYREREAYLNKWKAEMQKNNISFSDDSIVDLLVSLDSKVKWQQKGLKMDSVSLENVAILTESPLPQIIFDPYDILKSYFDKNDDYEFIDIEVKGFEHSLSKCAVDGKTCFIRVENLHFPYLVEKLIRSASKSRSEMAETYCCYIDEVQYEIKLSFKLIIVVCSPKISTDLGLIANVVDLSGEETMLQKVIAFRLFEKSRKEMVDTLIRSQKESLEKINQIAQCETKIQDLMARFEEALSEDSNLIESLQVTCMKVSDMRLKFCNITESLESAEKVLKSYESTALQITRLFSLVDRLNTADSPMNIGFQRFLSLAIDEIIPRKVQHTWSSLLEANTILQVAQGVYRHFQHQVTGFPLVAVGLLISTWYESILGSSCESILNILYNHNCQISEGSVKKNLLHAWMEDDRWFSLVFFLESSHFPNLLDHLEINPKLWYEWCSSEQPENMALPKHMEKNIKGISRLALVKCLRPDRFIEAGHIFIERTLRHSKKPLNVSATLINLACAGVAHEPIILRSHLPLPVENLLKRILPICHPGLSSESKAINIFTLGSGREEYLKFMIRSCVQKSYWVLLKCKSNAKNYITFIKSEMERIQKHGGNRRFKLWIYDLSDDLIHNRFSQSCQVIFIPLPLLLKESIEHLIELTGENKISCYTNNVMKLHLLCLALLHICLERRQNFPCDVIGLVQKISESHWNDVETVLREFMSGLCPEGLSLSSVINSFYSAGSLTESWCGVIHTTVANYLTPDMILNVNQRISALTHYSVPHSNDVAGHLAQLEFVYKAPSSVLTNVSQSLYNNQQTIYCKKVERILCHVWGKEEYLSPLRSYMVTCENLRQRLIEWNPKCSPVLSVYLKREKSYLVKVINLLLVNSKHNWENILAELQNLLTTSVSDSDILCRKCLLRKKLNFIIERAKYLLSIHSQESLTTKLILGNLREPLCFWSLVNRKIWFETNCEEVASVALTKETGVQDDISNEGMPEILLHNLFLTGTSWDFDYKRLKQEDKPSLSTLVTKFSLAVMPLSEGIRKLIDKSHQIHRTPVCSSLSSIKPLFWIYLLIDDTLTKEMCILRGVRILLN